MRHFVAQYNTSNWHVINNNYYSFILIFQLFRSQSLRLPTSADNSMNSLQSSPRAMIGYGNVETRIIESNYPVTSSLASIASNEESGHLYLSGRHTSTEHSREELNIKEVLHETEDER